MQRRRCFFRAGHAFTEDANVHNDLSSTRSLTGIRCHRLHPWALIATELVERPFVEYCSDLGRKYCSIINVSELLRDKASALKQEFKMKRLKIVFV